MLKEAAERVGRYLFILVPANGAYRKEFPESSRLFCAGKHHRLARIHCHKDILQGISLAISCSEVTMPSQTQGAMQLASDFQVSQ